MGFGMMELLFSLIVAGMGYIVLHLAGRSEGGMRLLGKIIGRIMIVVSTIVIILTLYILTNVIIRSMVGNRMQTVQQERVVKPVQTPRTVIK
jgi:hypothetical protein